MPELGQSFRNGSRFLEHIQFVLTGIRRDGLMEDRDSQIDSFLIRSEADSTIICRSCL